MSEPLIVALIAGPLSAAVTILLTKAFARRREAVEVDASVSEQWKAWSHEQAGRIEKLEQRGRRLEERVDQLEADLKAEREANADLTERNRRQAALMSSLIRWALELRDAVIQCGGHPPPAPPEVQAALTSIDPT